MREELVSGCFSGGLVEHVFEVDEGNGSGLLSWLHVSFNSNSSRVDYEVDAATDGCAELTTGGEEFGNGFFHQKGAVFAKDPTPGCAHADWSEGVRACWVFVQCHKPVGGHRLFKFGGDVCVEDEFSNGGEGSNLG